MSALNRNGDGRAQNFHARGSVRLGTSTDVGNRAASQRAGVYVGVDAWAPFSGTNFFVKCKPGGSTQRSTVLPRRAGVDADVKAGALRRQRWYMHSDERTWGHELAATDVFSYGRWYL